ncbi:MAG: chitobiase/beta-hexosaminidase C-terminal domain-containing protein, partial [Draconibacterium sp.]|nr:chitobiase/beta-hexosaminidase C-terminal domain-containing protein [Draconibacterium sp.]
MSELSLLIKTLQLHFVFGIVFFIFPIQKVHSEQIDSTLFELKVDFSKNSSPVWDGFSGFFAEHENNSSFLPQTYTINGNVITVEIAWPAGTVKEVKQMIDRGGNAGVEGSDLLRDWIGTDGRKERVPIVMTIKGVPPGVYEWKSFHHDNNDQTGVFNVEIKDALHSFTIKGVDISNGILPINSVTTLQTTLKSDSSDITFSFEMNSYPDNSTSFFVMNGFIINELDTSVVPGQVDLISPLNNLKYLSSDVEFKWTESYFANSYNLFLGKQNPPTLYATVDSLGYRTSDLEENTTYFWSVEAVNNNGSTNSEIRSFTTGDKNSTSFSGNLELTFSKERGFYDDPFQLEINVNSAGANIIYTVDCSTPSVENGLIYTKPVSIDSTTVIKAFALSSKSHSAVTTESYIFSSFVLKQGKKPSGFPETWAGKTIINADYEMDPEIIESPDYKSKINSAIKSVPSLSLTMDVDNWFNDKTGLYVGYPNSNETREKAVSAEFIFHDKDNFLVECGVQNQGGTSIINWKVPKQSMRLLFKEIYGTSRLHYKLFPNSDINSINTLVIDGLLYSWLHPWD